MQKPRLSARLRKIAVGDSVWGGYTRKRDAFGANFELQCKTGGIARQKYLGLKIAHLLFPRIFPNPVGVAETVLHTRYVAPHKELEVLQSYAAQTFEHPDDPKIYRQACNKASDVLLENKRRVERIDKRLKSMGLSADLFVTNVGIRKKRIIIYDNPQIDAVRLEASLEKAKISDSKKRAVMHFLEQYKELMKE